MRTIGVVTTSRADYGIVRPLLRALEADERVHVQLIAAGMHVVPRFGETAAATAADGFAISQRVEIPYASDTPAGIASSIGAAVAAFAASYARARPDLLLATGDRFEMHAAVLAALPFRIPVAHVHGGELTAGAIDDALRHGITKLSHLHFTATDEYARRVVQLGEEPWRVRVSGAPSLDNLAVDPRLSPAELTRRFGVPFDAEPLLATFHPVTLEHERTAWHVEELLAALDLVPRAVVFTLPNADTGSRAARERIVRYAAERRDAYALDDLGTAAYFSAMRCAGAMVGNSSSGIIEAPSFGLPVVNVGLRQAGRVRAANVIDVAHDRDAIAAGIRRALEPDFRAASADLVNPYGDGRAAPRIVERIAAVDLDDALLIKRFHDLAAPRAELVR